MDPRVKNAEDRMKKALELIRHEVATIRTNTATTALLDGIKVEYYGSPVPLQQVASVSVPESRMLMIQPWERAVLPEIVKADRKSTRLNSSHTVISYAVFCLKKKKAAVPEHTT